MALLKSADYTEERKEPGEFVQQPIRICATCGTKCSATGDRELCPVCLLLGSLGSCCRKSVFAESLVPESGSERKMEERESSSIARRFENYEVMLGEDWKPIGLGRGAMGVTYKAFDVDLRLPVVLKMIGDKYIGDQSAHLRFLREARAAAKVRHSNVASVFHLGRSSLGYFYAMEFVEGETLGRLIRRAGHLEVKLALEIVAQVAAGLSAIHEQQLIHRDIKPDNIIVNLKDGGRVTAKIIDLGLAKSVGDLTSESAISVLGGFAGTPEFASPEQFAGVGVDFQSDLYSLGITLWEMLTGQVPFRGSPAEVMYQHQRAPLPVERMKSVPQPVVALLDVLLEKDPARRLQSPTDLLKALPKVTDAIQGRRTIPYQSLQQTADQRRGASGKAIEILTGLRDILAARRVRLQLWPGFLLVIGAVMILAMHGFIGPQGSFSRALGNSFPAITASEKSIAVLPFESLSPSKEDTYFADGVQDEILSDLAKVSQLTVISRTSSMTYHAGGDRDLRSIATALGVAHIVEGTVRTDRHRVRVTTELIDARTDKTLWSDTYDRDLADIFAVQSEIAQTVASKLSAQLSLEATHGSEETPAKDLETSNNCLPVTIRELAIAERPSQ